MYKKIFFSLAIVAIAFLTGYATAQSFLNTPAKATPPKTTQAPVMTPKDFQSRTQELQQKKNEALSNQFKENLAKVPPTSPPAASSAPATTPPISSETAPARTNDTTPPTSSQALPSSESSSTVPAVPSGPIQTGPAPAPAEQADIYTGFQSGNQSQDQKQAAPASSGGWDIKY